METDREQVRELTCINCPLGCQVTVRMESGQVVDVSGNSCPRGERYARQEVADPRRIVTTSVPVVDSGLARMVSVKTAEPVPKDRMRDVVAELAGIRLESPVHIGDVVCRDVAGTGVDVVVTRNA